jgi:hypothetical protein
MQIAAGQESRRTNMHHCRISCITSCQMLRRTYFDVAVVKGFSGVASMSPILAPACRVLFLSESTRCRH